MHITEFSTENIAAFHLCNRCIGEEFFRSEVKSAGSSKICQYCKKKRKGISVERAAHRVEGILEKHFQPAAMEPNWLQRQMSKDRDSFYDFEPDGDPTDVAILNLADIPDLAARHIQALLHDKHGDWDMWASGETTPYAADLHYEEAPIDDERWHREWQDFEHSLKTETRYFNRHGDNLLSRIFEGLGCLKTRDGRSLIVEAGPDTDFNHFYRARTFDDDKSLKDAMINPRKQLGPPPAGVASPGRMNAQGVAVFYGATEPQVTISEIRPPVGSQVLLGRFDIVRPLQLLDLSRLDGIARKGSLFDPVFSAFLERAKFLHSFAQQMTRPVMPSQVAHDYLPTQAVADFLSSMDTVVLDGILYPSVQSGGAGSNVVLFHKASRVAQLEVTEGAKLEAESWRMYADGPEREYSIEEYLTETESDIGQHECIDAFAFGNTSFNQQCGWEHPASLRIDRDSLKVHLIERTEFVTDDYDVEYLPI